MPDRLTRKATRRSDPATDEPAAEPEDRLAGRLGKPVTVYLINGLKLTGTLRPFDPFTLKLERADEIDSLIFKPAIRTLIPGVPAVPRERQTLFGKRPARTE